MLKLLITQRNLLVDLVVNDLRGKYLGSFVGFLGAIINPLLILLIYSFVFSGILKIKFGITGGAGNFAIYLFGGLIPWIAFSEAVQRSSTILMDQRALIRSVHFSKEILPYYLTLSTFFSQLIALFVYFIVLLIIKNSLSIHIVFLILFFPFQILFTYGFCLFVSSMNIYFRDIGIFLGTVLQLWFFCTPIFYPESLIPERFMFFMKLNPMFHLVVIYRDLILNHKMPDTNGIFYFVLASMIIFFTGSLIFNKLKNKIIDHL